MTVAPLRAVLPEASVVTLVTAVPVPPTAPPKVVVPAVLTAKVCAPLIVDANSMLPVLVLVKVVFAPKLTALE